LSEVLKFCRKNGQNYEEGAKRVRSADRESQRKGCERGDGRGASFGDTEKKARKAREQRGKDRGKPSKTRTPSRGKASRRKKSSRGKKAYPSILKRSVLRESNQIDHRRGNGREKKTRLEKYQKKVP